ncbi:uncharacterized protein LOC121884734 [Thunnus maccoyii]|uniref:uncharacterized protein LOC121884734 n=1 Tax=Thunnus maccoyii TaxID=8240 RepID=UPI001C4B3C95|nr:uncharacterized protein LOC121884734 [Thunnus maccoyii]
MATADQLLELIFSWIEQRERCAEKLRKLARELESLRKKCNGSECIGSSVSVAGAACLIGAGVATLFTGGAAAPALGLLGVVSSGVGLTVSLATKLTEHLISSDTMKDAQKIEQKSNDIGETIQRLLKKLKAEKKGVNSFADPDELDRHVMTEILGAMARRSGLKWPINISSFGDGWGGARGFTGLDSPQLNPNLIMPEVMTAVAGVLICFSFQAEGKASKLLFAKGAEQLIKTVTSAGFKTFVKGGGMAVGGAVGMAFALSEAIDNWKDLIEKNHVTEASQSLRNTADAILKVTRTLRKQLDDIKKAFQRFQRKTLIEFAIENCEDEAVRRWLRVNSESDAFSQLVDMFHFLKKHIDEEEKKDHSNNVHITFDAHGCIGDSMIPASRLLPLPSITDVILYSPWNCSITADVAYGVATGRMKLQHRVFYCRKKDGCQIPDEKHRPSKLPDHWNSMKKAGDQKIPNITVSPMKPPEDGTWKKFESLKKKYGPPGRNHIVIPFILPAESSSLERVPFFIVTLALSLVLLSSRFKATVHLTACLSDRSAERKFDQEYLKQQYACTINNTLMTCSPDMFV